MPGLIKYSTSNTSGTLRKGNTVIGMGEVPESVAANMAPSIDVPPDGYVVYTIGLNNTPKMWAVTRGVDLLPIAKTLGGSSKTVEDAIYYICSLTDAWILDNPINDIVDDGLALYLNTENLSSYPGVNTSFMDISGGGINGTLYNGPVFNSNGFLEFDGVDDYAIIGSANDIQFGTGDFTIEALFKPIDDGGGWTGVVAKGASGATGFAMNYYANGNGTVTLRMSITAPSNQHYSSGHLTSDKWYHIVMVFDRDTAGYVYNNGDLTYSHTALTSNNQTVDNSGYPLRLSTFGGGSWFLNGAISKVKLYNRTLSESEVLQNFHQGPIVTNGLIFAADAGNLVSYQSGSANANSLIGSLEGDVVNSPTFNSNNKGFWEFDGTDDRINFSSTQILSDLGVTSGDDNDVAYSIEAWIRVKSYPNGVGSSGDSIIGFNDEHGIGLQVFGNGSRAYFNFGYRSNNNYDSGDISLNTWYHVVATRDTGGGSGNYKIYINNVKNRDAYGDLRVNYTTADMGIGNSPSRIGPFNGDIALTRIYNKALTQADVSQNWNAQKNRFI